VHLGGEAYAARNLGGDPPPVWTGRLVPDIKFKRYGDNGRKIEEVGREQLGIQAEGRVKAPN
jgi:hypothetical protein